ncbi:hypothetical protein ABU113_05630 [Sphingosinicellaceae bacterium M-36]
MNMMAPLLAGLRAASGAFHAALSSELHNKTVSRDQCFMWVAPLKMPVDAGAPWSWVPVPGRQQWRIAL